MQRVEESWTDIKQCPRCSGYCNREHYAEEPIRDGKITLLYCEFCRRGWETVFRLDGDQYVYDFHAEHSSDRPIELGKFLQRLKDARCIAA